MLMLSLSLLYYMACSGNGRLCSSLRFGFLLFMQRLNVKISFLDFSNMMAPKYCIFDQGEKPCKYFTLNVSCGVGESWEVVWELLVCCCRLLWRNHSETLVYIAGYQLVSKWVSDFAQGWAFVTDFGGLRVMSVLFPDDVIPLTSLRIRVFCS